MSARDRRKSSAPDRLPAAPARAAAARRGMPTWGWVTLIVVLGVVVRLVCVSLAPGRSYLADHLDFAAWSEFIVQHGPANAFDLSEPGLINTRFVPPRVAQPFTVPYRHGHMYAYPPGSAYLFWLQGVTWRVMEPTPTTLALPPGLAAQLGVPPQEVTSRVADTFAARFANAFVPGIFDFLMAWGVAGIVRALRRPNDPAWLPLAAFALAIFAPPIILDSAFWNQTDSPVTCLLVWCVYGLVVERFWLAGVFFGLAAAVKPQAILLGPVFVFVFLALRFRPGGTWLGALRLGRTAAAALLTLAAVLLPTALSDARSPTNNEGPWRWFRLGYFWTMVQKHPQTTLNAYNVWWLDYLGGGAARPVPSEGDSLLGLSKATLGKLFAGAAVLAAGLLCARRWRWGKPAWLAFAFLVCAAAFLFPTRVHERYIYYCLPFAIAAAFVFPRWIPALVALLLVGTFSMTWFLWYQPVGQPLVFSGLLAMLAVASFVYALVALVPVARAGHASPR